MASAPTVMPYGKILGRGEKSGLAVQTARNGPLGKEFGGGGVECEDCWEGITQLTTVCLVAFALG